MSTPVYDEIEQPEPSGEMGTVIRIPLDQREVASRMTRNLATQVAEQAAAWVELRDECRRLGFPELAQIAEEATKAHLRTEVQIVKMLEMLDAMGCAA